MSQFNSDSSFQNTPYGSANNPRASGTKPRTTSTPQLLDYPEIDVTNSSIYIDWWLAKIVWLSAQFFNDIYILTVGMSIQEHKITETVNDCDMYGPLFDS